MIRPATEQDFDAIHSVINDSATAYKDVIPADRWHDPYMTNDELNRQMGEGVKFSCFIDNGRIIGVMGIQDRGDVDLIRHAYVLTSNRRQGVGNLLIRHLLRDRTKPVLVGTWKDASWAVSFYEKHGFTCLSDDEKNRLLRTYWSIPERQVETSVVLADGQYFAEKTRVP
jgi:N-acetylglutamate synthase-like GNAT family acetyltransferase